MMNIKELLDEVKKLNSEEKFEDSLSLCEKILETEPESKEVNQLYTETLFSYGYYLNDDLLEGYEKAVEIFSKLLEIEPDNAKAMYNKGISFFNMNKMNEALECYEGAIKMKPDYKYVYYNIGLVHEELENFHEAKKYYEKALEIDPNFLYAMNAKHEVKQFIKMYNIPKPATKVNIEKLKTLLQVSKRVRISTIQEIMGIKSNNLDTILNWCKRYQFEIDGDFLIINKERLQELIISIDNQF